MKLRVFKSDGRWWVGSPHGLGPFGTWEDAFRWAHDYVWAVRHEHDAASGQY